MTRRHTLLRPRSTRFEPVTDRGVSAAGSLALHRPTSLARPRRLIVPPSRHIVRAAPTHRCNSSGKLPSASPNCCGSRGQVSNLRGYIALRGAPHYASIVAQRLIANVEIPEGATTNPIDLNGLGFAFRNRLIE